MINKVDNECTSTTLDISMLNIIFLLNTKNVKLSS